MSLFGGDTPLAADSSGSEFSISPISSPERQASQASQEPQQETEEFAQTADVFPSPFDLLEADDNQDEEGVDENELNTHERPADGQRERYKGSDAMYRYHIRRERTLFSSLEQLQANDLSLHLYNAHAWKARLRSREQYAAKGPFRRKSAWIPGGRGQGHKDWYPDQSWTSWPLDPSSVPRPGEDFSMPHGTRREVEQSLIANGWKPREELQEDVFGLLLGRAKENWISRPGATSPVANRNVSPEFTRRRRSTSKQRQRMRSASSPLEDAREDPGPDDPDIDPKHESVAEEDSFGSLPVISADDDQLRSVLRPTANHIFSQLDDLLMALHHNRNGQYRSERESNAEGSRSRSHSRGSKPQCLRKKDDDDEDNDTDAFQSGNEIKAASSKSRSRSRKRYKTTDSNTSETGRERSSSVASSADSDYGPYHRNPRDWSELLGLAALIGWDEAALQRTLQRCADLFGEDMELHSSGKTSIADRAEPPRPTSNDIGEDTIRVAEATPSITPIQQFAEGTHYICPFVDCPHHSLPYPASKGYRFREHLGRAHKFSPAQIKELEAGMQVVGRTVSSTKSNPRGWIAPDPLVCPFPACRRAQEPFPASNRLVEHLVRAHKWNPRKEPPPPALQTQSNDPSNESPSVPAASDALNIDSDDEIIGGVHNDGFMQPFEVHKGRAG